MYYFNWQWCGCYGYNNLKITSVATIAPPLVDSKHYNSFPFSLIWVDPLCTNRFMTQRVVWTFRTVIQRFFAPISDHWWNMDPPLHTGTKTMDRTRWDYTKVRKDTTHGWKGYCNIDRVFWCSLIYECMEKKQGDWGWP